MNPGCRFYKSSFETALALFAFLREDRSFNVSTSFINYECSIIWKNSPLQLRLGYEIPDIPRLWMTYLVDNLPKEESVVVMHFPASLQETVKEYFERIESMHDSELERAFLKDEFANIHIQVISHYSDVVRLRLEEFVEMAGGKQRIIP